MRIFSCTNPSHVPVKGRWDKGRVQHRLSSKTVLEANSKQNLPDLYTVEVSILHTLTWM